jgi:hypothetical protein
MYVLCTVNARQSKTDGHRRALQPVASGSRDAGLDAALERVRNVRGELEGSVCSLVLGGGRRKEKFTHALTHRQDEWGLSGLGCRVSGRARGLDMDLGSEWDSGLGLGARGSGT